MIGIYKITSPTKKVYIGQSINIEKRFNTYKNLNCKQQTILYNSLLKYGFDKHTFEVLCECEISELNDKERYYQDIFSVVGNNGLNCMLTSSSDRSGKHSEETKLKIIESRKWYSHSEETKLKISIANSGKIYKHSEVIKNKLKVANLKRFDESVEKSWLKNMPKGYVDKMRKHFL